jgi:hypothetical protein
MQHQADIVLESCNSTWLFDSENAMYCRVVKEENSNQVAASRWQPYFKLELEQETEYFVVWLNEDGTRRLRSWRHQEHCDACGGEVTTELDLSAIASLRREG